MDTLDEQAVRTLLHTIASTPEPPPAVDVPAARRRGSRRLRARRAAFPLVAVVAVVAALTVPRTLVPGHPERKGATPQPPATSPVADAPWEFDPLVPYASFGWLPPGFSESAANGIVVGQGVASGPDFVSREAAAPAAGHLLYLQVNARGTCAVSVAGLQANIRAHGSELVTCTQDSFNATGAAPSVKGQPAFWTDRGSGVAWEYAPGAWAELAASEIGGGELPPSAATEAQLLNVAAHVAYGDATPLAFPFRLTGLPAGWQLWRTSFTASGGRMIGTGITVGPASDTSALSISASAVPGAVACYFTGGQSVTRLGVKWMYSAVNERNNAQQRLCATGPVEGLTGVSLTMDMTDPASGAQLPGSAELGGALGVLARLRLLGTNPAAWTTAPLG